MRLLIKFRQPTERGFFCYDLSIYHPYHGSTVTALVNNLVSYGAPMLIILVRYWCDMPGPSTPRPLEKKFYLKVKVFNSIYFPFHHKLIHIQQQYSIFVGTTHIPLERDYLISLWSLHNSGIHKCFLLILNLLPVYKSQLTKRLSAIDR